jgi:hypothetical protein
MAFGTMVNRARCSLRTIVIAAWSPPTLPDPVEVPTSTASASRAAARVIVVRGRRSTELVAYVMSQYWEAPLDQMIRSIGTLGLFAC